MDKNETYNLIVTYTDGSHDQFKFPSQMEKLKIKSILEKLLSSSVLTLQMEDSLLVIPTANIRSAEVFPFPDHLPEVVLRSVHRLPRDS